MAIDVIETISVEDSDLYGWDVTGYADFTEIQYYEYENGKKVFKGMPISFAKGEITTHIANAMLKVNRDKK